LAPLVGGLALFGSDVFGSGGGVQAVKMPYLVLALAFFAIATVVKLIHLPGFENTETVEVGVRVFRHPGFKWGCLAIFFYVGSEVTVGSILINYLGEKNILGLPHHEADKYLSFYWGGLMIGRLVGAIALSGLRPSWRWIWMATAALLSTLVIFASATFKQKFTTGDFVSTEAVWPYLGLVALSFVFFALGRSKSGATVGIFALVAAALTIFSMLSRGELALWSIIGIGLFNSIMWSNIFTLSIKGLGKDTPQGSSLLVMMIVGGAFMPLIQGALMDAVGVQWSLSVVLVGYSYLAFFGFIGSRQDMHRNSVGETIPPTSACPDSRSTR
jgi:FHS family L-fucose permease-like MFS transporter